MSAKRNSLLVQKRVKLVPPDGGWGWMVILGTALCNIFNQSMLSLFSLLYGDALESMGHKTSGIAIVMSTMLFVSNFGGPIAGALVKMRSPRFVCISGAVLCTIGIFFSGFSTNIYHLILTYGVLLGLGLGFVQNASFVAINSYFKLKKSRAVGLAMVGTGIGQALMPLLVDFLLKNYGFRGACLLLSGLSLHGIAGTMLIQPVKWHMKKVEEEVPVDEKLQLLEEKHKDIVIRKNSYANGDTTYNGARRATEPSVVNGTEKPQAIDMKSLSHKDLNAEKNKSHENGVNGHQKVVEPQEKGWVKKLTELFDISLLKSPRFLNIVLGTAIATTSIQNFSMLFPLFLQKVAHMDKKSTALCMSTVAIADIVGRLTLPVVQDHYKVKARWMFLLTCVWLLVVRQIMAYQSTFTMLVMMSALYGVGRSMIIVCRNISISENCRMDQVPAAVGLGMLAMGIVVPPTGYFLGWIRDFTDSYVVCITAQNMLLVFLICSWLPDLLLLYMQEKREQKKDIQTSMS